MTRGQRGWLDLRCQGLTPFSTVPACPGAYPNAALQARGAAEATQERRLFPVACKRWLGWGTPYAAAGVPRSGPPACPCPLLLDHLIRQKEERRGERDPERLRRLEVEDQLELHRLLHRQVPW